MSSTTNILITGANRGIGKALLTTYLARPSHILIAGVRDPSSAAAKDLQSLPKGANSELVIVKIDSASETDALEAVKTIKLKHLDLVIANAGIANYYGPVLVAPADEMISHFRVNVIGPMLLFQATASLLEASPKPIFTTMSSILGSVGSLGDFPIPTSAYGTSKSALNFLTAKIHFEHPNIIVFPTHPGWLQTDMGNAGAVGVGMTEAPTSVKEGVEGLVKIYDAATKETISGKLVSYTGDVIPW